MTEVFGLAYNTGGLAEYWKKTTLRVNPYKITVDMVKPP
jgi:hypothetical protein